MIRTLTLTSLVLAAGLAVAQPPVQTEKATSPFGGGITTKLKSAKKSSLETSIDLALANNPDLRVAEAKVREAEASLSRTRLQVLQKVVSAYHALDVARAAVKQAEAYMERVTKLGAASAISQAEVDKATAALAAAKSALAAAQAELDYLQGKVTTKGVTWTTPTFSTRYDPVLTEATLREDWRSRTRQDLFVEKIPHGASADRLREALKTKLSLSVTEVPAKDFLDQLRRKAPDVHIQVSPRMSWEGGDHHGQAQ